MNKKELLVMCCVCQKIRIDDTSDFWLSREENPEGYDSIMKEYEKRISDTYCSEHLEKAMKEVKRYKEIKVS